MALLQAGKCHEELTETEKAIQAYQQLLDEFPSTTSAPAAKERLNAMQTGQNKP
jgi:TolA-binding protein